MPDSSPEQAFLRFRKDGDVQALGEVFDRVAPNLLIVAARLAAPDAEPEDLVQQTFLEAIRHADRYEAGRPLTSWLTGILANCASVERRRNARRPDPTRLPVQGPVDPGEEAQARETAEQLHAGASNLSSPYRQVMILRLVHGLSVHEIADALDRPSRTVRSQLRRGMDMLRRTLPKGLPALALLEDRGLAIVRKAVMEAACGTGALVAGGTFFMKKVLIALLLVSVVSLGLWQLVSGSPGSAPPMEAETPDPLVARTAEPTGDETGGSEAMVPSTGLPRRVLAAVEDAEGAGLWVRVRSQGTGEPVPARLIYFEEEVIRQLPDSLAEEYRRRSGDREWLGERLGTTAIADAEGRARIPARGGTVVVGRHGELYGETTLVPEPNRDPEEEHELVLETDVSFEVFVVEHGGAPAAGIDVGFARVYPPGDDRNPVRTEAMATTLEDGVVVLTHVQLRFYRERMWEEGLPLPIEYLLRPSIPGFTQGGISIDPRSPPTDRVILQLPEMGRILVSIEDAQGRKVRIIPFFVELSDPSGDHEWGGTANRGGPVVFDPVVAGRSYRARSPTRTDEVTGLFDGPVGDGDEVHYTLRMDQSFYAVSGRLVDGHNDPLADLRARVEIQTLALSSGGSFLTDETGHFWTFLRPAEKETTLTALSVESQNEGPRFTYRFEGRRPFVLGENDLGDLVLQRSEEQVLGAGRILVDGDAPDERIDGFVIQAWRPQDGPDPGGGWYPADATMEIDENGSFEILGIRDSDRYRVDLPHFEEAFVPVEPLEFAAGTRNLEIALRAAGSLKAQVLVEEGLPTDNLWLRLIPTSGQVPAEHLEVDPGHVRFMRNRLYAGLDDDRDLGSDFRWDGLWPGSYVLEALPRGGRIPLITIPDIRIEKGPNRDPRLDGIDLMGMLRKIVITVTDPPGNSVEEPLVALESEGADLLQAYRPLHGSGVEVLTAEDYLDLIVGAEGYVPQHLGVTGDTRVVLEPFPRILVRIAGGLPPLPEGRVLRVSVEDSGESDPRRYASDTLTSVLRLVLEPRKTSADFGDGNEVALQVKEGEVHRIVLSVVNTITGASSPIAGTEPATVEVQSSQSPRLLEIRVPGQGLQEALGRVDG